MKPSPIRKYLAVLSVGISRTMEYRVNMIASSVLWTAISVFVQASVWKAVYYSSGGAIAGVPADTMLFYIICASICLAFTHSRNVERTAAEEIRNGELNKYLLKPISHLLYTFSASIADRASTVISILVLSTAMAVPLTMYGVIDLSVASCAVALGFLILAIILRFLMSMMITYIAFWLDETWTFHVVLDICLWFLSGMMLPMSILPESVRRISDLLPFQFLAYIPAGLLSGSIPITDSWKLLLIATSWILILWAATMALWRRGIVKFGAYGG